MSIRVPEGHIGGIVRVTVSFSARSEEAARGLAMEYLKTLFADDDFDVLEEDVHECRGAAAGSWESVVTAEMHVPD